MKSFIIFAVCLWVTLASGRRVPRSLSPKEIDKIEKLSFPQDSNCGRFFGHVNYSAPKKHGELHLPWIVSITNKNNYQHLCDGMLIYPDVLLSSAHCVNNIIDDKLMVTAKTQKNVSRSSYSDTYERDVTEIHVDPKYSACSHQSDLAILILSKPFILNDHIKVICLPDVHVNYYTGNCVMKLMDDEETEIKKWGHRECEGRVFIAPNSSYSLRKASCEQGNGTDALISRVLTDSMSCQSASQPDQFYYLGSSLMISMCGSNVNFLTYDTLYKSLSWMHNVLKRRFIYYESRTEPVWY